MVYKLCGGICATLEALLKNGVNVNKYFDSDTSPAAQKVARFRVTICQRCIPTAYHRLHGSRHSAYLRT
jgi:hypothetical protein